MTASPFAGDFKAGKLGELFRVITSTGAFSGYLEVLLQAYFRGGAPAFLRDSWPIGSALLMAWIVCLALWFARRHRRKCPVCMNRLTYRPDGPGGEVSFYCAHCNVLFATHVKEYDPTDRKEFERENKETI